MNLDFWGSLQWCHDSCLCCHFSTTYWKSCTQSFVTYHSPRRTVTTFSNTKSKVPHLWLKLCLTVLCTINSHMYAKSSQVK